MLKTRVIPCLLLDDGSFVKTRQFKNPTYIGDAINAVRIYNELEVDEIIILDITATKQNKAPDFDKIAQLTEECFMPFTYGGGIKTYNHAQKLFDMGVEKISLNSAVIDNTGLIEKISQAYGAQAVVVSIDFKKARFSGKTVYGQCGRQKTKLDIVAYAQAVEKMGAGEILLNAIDRDGMMEGFDLDIIRAVSDAVDIPVIAAGGAGTLDDIAHAKEAGANAIALGSMAVYQNKNRGILINFPDYQVLRNILKEA